MKVLLGHRVIQVACGSRDAQTLALTDEGESCLTPRFVGRMLWDAGLMSIFLNLGLVFSWGDGDFGKLGRGGSEGCNIPQNIERLNGQGVCQIECGAQFSLALTKSGVVWTWYVSACHPPVCLFRGLKGGGRLYFLAHPGIFGLLFILSWD